MNVIAVVSSKGGVGKTSLASALAVLAAKESKRVAMVDLDPQASLADWWKRRGGTENPQIFTGEDTASEAVEALELDGWDWVFIDTPPAFLDTIEDAIKSADLALIPLKASALDLIASEDAVKLARDLKKQHLCVINDAEPRWKTTAAAKGYLQKGGVPVAEQIVTHRAAYLGAMTSGKSGPEIDRTGACAEEIGALWAQIKSMLKKAKPAKKVARHG